jgi:hypothetical protein
LIGIAWGSWELYDRWYRQPRFTEMRQLYTEWREATAKATYAKIFIGAAGREVEIAIRDVAAQQELVGLGLGADNPEMQAIRRQADADHKAWEKSFRADAAAEDAYWSSAHRKWQQRAVDLDNLSKARFGVPAAELPNLLPR